MVPPWLKALTASRYGRPPLHVFKRSAFIPTSTILQHRHYSSQGSSSSIGPSSERFAGKTSSQPRRRTGDPTVILSLSVLSGVVGYTIAQRGFREAPVDGSPYQTTFGTPQDFELAIAELKDAFSQTDAVSTDADDLHTHGFSSNIYHPGALHSVIVYPESTEDVVKIVKIATKYRMPVVPYSGATSLEGQFRGHEVGGICVDLNRMDKIIQINEKDSDIVCQPAVRWMDINELLREKGIPLFFPIDPGPGATIGGMLSTGCSGTNAVRYGTAKGEWFLNATVVLPSGEVIKTRRRSRKSAAGFDLTKLFIGAEGTLGIVTEVTIRLAPLLPTNVAVVHFPDVRAATEASIEIINQGAGIQCIELIDALSMKATNNYGKSKRKWQEKDSLFFKFQGPTDASLKETAQMVKKISEKHGSSGFALAKNQTEAEEIWTDRKNLYYSGLSLIPGSKGITTDVCVPISKLPDLIYETRKDLDSVGLVSPIIGHVGDGNFHALLLFKNDEEFKIAKEAVGRISRRAIELEGTCTGEHGIGIGKKEYLVEELGEGTVELMRTIKKAVDPLGLFNPGKLYPDRTRQKSK